MFYDWIWWRQFLYQIRTTLNSSGRQAAMPRPGLRVIVAELVCVRSNVALPVTPVWAGMELRIMVVDLGCRVKQVSSTQLLVVTCHLRPEVQRQSAAGGA